MFDDLEPFSRSLIEEIKEMEKSSASLERQLEKRHAHISQFQEGQNQGQTTPGGEIKLEGYLFKRGQNAFRTWNRRWFYLQVR